VLARGYQVTGKLKAWQRVAKRTRAVASDAWPPTSSPGREVAAIPSPLAFARPTHQDAVRTPAAKKPEGFYHAVRFTTRAELTIEQTVDHDDARAGIESPQAYCPHTDHRVAFDHCASLLLAVGLAFGASRHLRPLGRGIPCGALRFTA
jgi:hypothetical protein